MADKYTFDGHHSNIGFAVKHMMVTTVRGKFTDYAGEVEVEGDDPTTARATFTIKTASIDTDNEQRDAHLRSGDFFDAETYPEMTFVSRSVTKAGDAYQVAGDLTIRGVTKPVELTVAVENKFVDPWGNERVGVSATGSINRTDWGLTWNQTLEAGRLLVAEKVNLEIESAIVRPAGVPASA
jgi:polyisoprenoid-binding protein YceI